jgi:hypothetical protein
LNRARKLSWTSGKSKVLIMIGDSIPHSIDYPGNSERLDWENEAGLLGEAGIAIYSVHALAGIRSFSKQFYTKIANMTGGFYLTLDQFDAMRDIISAVCYQQKDKEMLKVFGNDILTQGRMSESFNSVYKTLSGESLYVPSKTESSWVPVSPGRFQVLYVDKDQSIKSFVEENGLPFKQGNGFYELSKTVEVQTYKQIILMDKKTGKFYEGTQARSILGLSPERDKKYGISIEKLYPANHINYRVFIQSTSVNRKLISGTTFLYEVDC